jgi:hypothetical protein
MVKVKPTRVNVLDELKLPYILAIAPQSCPILVRNNQPGRPRKRVKVLAADKGYDSKDLRAALRKRGIRPQLPKRTSEDKEKSG